MTDDAPRQPDNPRDDSDAPPPFGGTWRRVYTGLLTLLALYIAIFYAISVAFR